MKKISLPHFSLAQIYLRPNAGRDWLVLLALVLLVLVVTVAPILWTYFDLVSNYEAKMTVENIAKKSTINEKRLSTAIGIIDERAKVFAGQTASSSKIVDPAQ
jgi:cell division protein YceG involved in septum cleavage